VQMLGAFASTTIGFGPSVVQSLMCPFFSTLSPPAPFRRNDHHGGAKFGWTVLILFIPILGALIYIIARPADAMYASTT
jgi:Phospholipase_D-nuclease N-terminal